jgi:hypothetical protein
MKDSNSGIYFDPFCAFAGKIFSMRKTFLNKHGGSIQTGGLRRVVRVVR